MAVPLQPEKTGPINGHVESIARIAILAIALLLLTRNVTGLFTGWREDNNALYSVFAVTISSTGWGTPNYLIPGPIRCRLRLTLIAT